MKVGYFFKDVIHNAAKKFIPTTSSDHWQKKSTSKNRISNDVKKLFKKKYRLWTRYQETRYRTIETQYKQIRNQVRKKTREISKKIQNDVAKTCKENLKKFLRFVNSKNKK